MYFNETLDPQGRVWPSTSINTLNKAITKNTGPKKPTTKNKTVIKAPNIISLL